MDEGEGDLQIVYAKELPTKNARRFGGVRTNVQSVLRRPIKHEKFPELELEGEYEEEEEEEEEDEDRELYFLQSIFRVHREQHCSLLVRCLHNVLLFLATYQSLVCTLTPFQLSFFPFVSMFVRM